jgi:hypothetical protein
MFTSEQCEWKPIWDQYYEASASGKSSLNACQVRSGNSCGSGTFIGIHNGGALVGSNAHVTGTKLGSQSQFRFDPQVSQQPRTGQIIMAGYSTKVTADWSINWIPDWIPNIKPAWCSGKPLASAQRFYTTGSPGCVWPLKHQSGLKILSDNNQGFAVWDQPAIGGQSGSGVWDTLTNWTSLLLTWRTSNNRGAGQPWYFIRSQAELAMVTGQIVGAEMPDDLTPLSDVNPDAEPGFWCEASLLKLPIWAEDQTPAPDPGPGPTPGIGPSREELIASYEKIRSESALMLAKLNSPSGGGLPNVPPSGGQTFGL